MLFSVAASFHRKNAAQMANAHFCGQNKCGKTPERFIETMQYLYSISAHLSAAFLLLIL